jgi:hypothetical protein
MKKPLLYLLVGVFLGASSFYGLRMLRKALRKQHVEQVELARTDWVKQAETLPVSNKSFRNRFSACDDELLLSYFNLKRDRNTETVKTEGNIEVWNRFLPLFNQWPQGLKEYCERYVSHVYVVDELGSSAYVLQQNDSSFTILINRDAMESLPNDWFTSREATAINLTSEYAIDHRIETDSNNRPEFTLETLLIHEVAHCIGITAGQTREFDSGWGSLGQHSLLDGVFQVANVAMEMTEKNQSQFGDFHYYRKTRLGMEEYVKRLRLLRNSPFPTMYSSVNDLEYFADFFYTYVHCIVLKRPLEYAVFKDGNEITRVKSGISLQHQEERCSIISNVLSELENQQAFR